MRGTNHLIEKPGIPDHNLSVTYNSVPGGIQKISRKLTAWSFTTFKPSLSSSCCMRPGAPKMMFSCEQAIAVYNPVGRYMLQHVMRSIHGPAYHARRSACTQVACNGAVRRNPAVRD